MSRLDWHWSINQDDSDSYRHIDFFLTDSAKKISKIHWISKEEVDKSSHLKNRREQYNINFHSHLFWFDLFSILRRVGKWLIVVTQPLLRWLERGLVTKHCNKFCKLDLIITLQRTCRGNGFCLSWLTAQKKIQNSLYFKAGVRQILTFEKKQDY